ACYNELLASWPVPFTRVRLSSRFGTTHVIICGPEDGPPLVLLHASGTSSTVWSRNVGALSRTYRTYLVDIIGDPNLSDCTSPLKSRSDFVEWLSDCFNQLKIERADVAGISFGGWTALNFAMGAPHRVKRLVLLSPAGLMPFRLMFFVYFLGPILFPSKRRAYSVLKWLAGSQGAVDERMAEQMFLAIKHFKIPLGGIWPSPFPDDDLRGLRVPTLLFIGEREVVVKPRRAFERATTLIPGIQAELVANAGHLLNREQAESVNQRVLEFLAGAGK
ncbi:MAG TPA: alpha/beta fold hydrolase, partial [Symbiobacteriaceae bacterium]|nr:alpha/beta fold hydrolase [Symbiobacteriaceae bacterium]